MSTAKLNEKNQKNLKLLSKITYILAKIFKVFSVIAIVSTTILIIGSYILIPNIKIDTKNKTITIFDKKYDYKYKDLELDIDTSDDENITFNYTLNEKEIVEKFINESDLYKESLITMLGLGLILSCFFLFKLLGYIEKLFVNIHNNDTPFTEDNIDHIKNIGLFYILYALIPLIPEILIALIFKLDINVRVNSISYLLVLIIGVAYYIFKYGYELQKNSKQVIYSKETNE